jgi:hypothetical protein
MTGIDPIDPPDLPEPSAAYAHGTICRGAGRVVLEVLGDHRPAITEIITDIYGEEPLLEIEGIAVA